MIIIRNIFDHELLEFSRNRLRFHKASRLKESVFIETKTLKTLTLYVSGFSALYDAMHLFFLENKLLDKNISISSLSPTEPSHTQ